MNLRQLSYFVSIAESGTFSAAADALHVAQSALSRHVKELEEELGGALLDRGSRGVTLSDSGKVLFERAKFSPHAVGPSMKDDAIEALAGLRSELEVQRMEAA